MTFKPLLIAFTVPALSFSAYAFPELTLSPQPGTYSSVDNFSIFNINGDQPFTVVENSDQKPYFEHSDSKDIVNCSSFFYFELDRDNSTTILNFKDSDFTRNGDWNLIFPPGCMKDANGNLNGLLSFSYNLQDPNIGLDNFPQITLISSNPADGSSLSYWGLSLGKVSFKTSDDDAVNYIGWSLYDVTYGTGENERIWIRQGSENRYDFNRYEHNNDIWSEGLFISIGGNDTKLLINHTYRLELEFCGIGYNPSTNQYPSLPQLEKSRELSTYLEFHGEIPESTYSIWEVSNVSPDPENYEFDNPDWRTFTVYYTGYVKPVKFEYPLGMAEGTATAGTYSPASATNLDGYATAWNFTFFEDVLVQATGELMVTIEAKDEDGYFVRGNGGYDIDDFGYQILWKANLGADNLISIDPENKATVDRLYKITVGNAGDKVMSPAYLATEKPLLMSSARAEKEFYLELDDPVFAEEGKTVTWTFEPVTTEGKYTLIIPKSYFIIGSDNTSTLSNQTVFSYEILGNGSEELSYSLLPSSISIENNAVYDEAVKEISIYFDSPAFTDLENPKAARLYKYITELEEEVEFISEVFPTEDNFYSPLTYTYTFDKPLDKLGKYKFVIGKGTFFNETYQETEGKSGLANPELEYIFNIDLESGIGNPLKESLISIIDITGRIIHENASASALRTLAPGIYIINGMKLLIK